MSHPYEPGVSVTGAEICRWGADEKLAYGRLANHWVHRERTASEWTEEEFQATLVFIHEVLKYPLEDWQINCMRGWLWPPS